MMSNRDTVKVVEDIMWLLTVTRPLLRNIREKNLVEEFAGEDSNAFDYVQDEVEKMWEKYT